MRKLANKTCCRLSCGFWRKYKPYDSDELREKFFAFSFTSDLRLAQRGCSSEGAPSIHVESLYLCMCIFIGVLSVSHLSLYRSSCISLSIFYPYLSRPMKNRFSSLPPLCLLSAVKTAVPSGLALFHPLASYLVWCWLALEFSLHIFADSLSSSLHSFLFSSLSLLISRSFIYLSICLSFVYLSICLSSIHLLIFLQLFNYLLCRWSWIAVVCFLS